MSIHLIGFIFLILSVIALFKKSQYAFHFCAPVAIYCFIKIFFKIENVIFLSTIFYIILIIICLFLSVSHLFHVMHVKYEIFPKFFRTVYKFCNFYYISNPTIIFSVTVFCGLLSVNEYTDFKNAVIGVTTCVTLALLTFVFFNNDMEIINYTVKSDKIQSEIKIAHVSDTHNNDYLLGNLHGMIEDEEVDLILLTGDIFDNDDRFDSTKKLMEELVNVAPVYYTPGNHEMWEEKTFEKIAEMEKIGVNYVGDSFLNVNVKNNEILIAGIIDPELSKAYSEQSELPEHSEYKGFEERFQILNDKVKNMTEINKLKILLSHRPEKVELYKNSDFDFVLSGHAHGGQVRIPFLLNGLFAPNQGFFPKYAGGVYKLNEKTSLIVSRGLKITDIPRVMNPPELVIITMIES